VTTEHITANNRILVAVDIAKLKHVALIELNSGQRKKMMIRNQMADFQDFSQCLKSLLPTCLIGFEPTGDYYRNLAYFLKKEGFYYEPQNADR
jgi:transposase